MSENCNQTVQHLYNTLVNCSNMIKIDANINIFEIIVTCPITLFGGLFNAIALWVFCCRMSKWTEARIYMISLAMADCTLVFTLPFVTYFHYREWPVDCFCKVISVIYSVNLPMSNFIITLIALDRYIAIKYPLKAKALRSPWKAAISSLFLWLCCVLFEVMITMLPSEEKEYCFYRTSEYPHFILFYIISFFIALLILIFCSTQVIRCLKEKQNASLQEKKLTQKALHIISVNMAAFIICFLPFNLSLLVRIGADQAQVDCRVRSAINKAVSITLCISHFNCCLDAICYYLVAKEFKEAASFLPRFQLKQSRRRLTASKPM